ncbi:hypothetical protein PN441_19585 [Spirulina major CS-329]|nr:MULTISPECIES: hypothetical protein [Spirulina]MDB9496763.1 hypothetical protein [Spirulina subsalsa CS-330]MDB9505287.1 hypothetical protein [Spirulina major CS-329]
MPVLNCTPQTGKGNPVSEKAAIGTAASSERGRWRAGRSHYRGSR